MNSDHDKGFYDFDLNIQLETQIDSYEQDRQDKTQNQVDYQNNEGGSSKSPKSLSTLTHFENSE